MAINDFVNEAELRKAIQQINPDGDLFEIRIIGKGKPISGYFKDADTLITKLKTIDLRNMNVYVTLNQISDDLFSRIQSETFVAGANATHDNEVIGYKYLFIDLDPKRAAGISSSDEELKEAYNLAAKVYEYLKVIGFEEPVKAVSGNGAHLLYRIQLANTSENVELVKKCLNALSMMFDNDKVSVDTANFNPSRICKLYGTLAQKGKSTEKRPFRLSRIIGDVKTLRVTDKAYLEKLAAELPQEAPKPTKYNNYNTSDFKIEDWLNKYGLSYRKADFNGGTKYLLDECPFDANHKSPDSMVTITPSGAIGFKCLHNSCADKHWRDLRLKFEPDAYEYSDEDRRIEEGWRSHNRDKDIVADEDKPITKIVLPRFLNASMIYNATDSDGEYIKSGINEIDRKLKGLKKGNVSLVSGLRGAAKSTILSQVMLNCVEHEQTSIIYSGELPKKSFLRWTIMQAAGKSNTLPYTEYEGFYCKKEVEPKIVEWLKDYMWLYNNEYGNNFGEISKLLREQIKNVKADICIVDNLMALDLSALDQDKYDAQSKFVWELKSIAEDLNVHVIFVAHPRKAQGFLRLDDISGSGNIANIVDNAFIIHRNNADFQRMTQQMFGWKSDNDAYSGTNVIEICKDRNEGTQDYFIPLWYERESKRLKNYESENIIYGWNDGFVSIPDEQLEEIPF